MTQSIDLGTLLLRAGVLSPTQLKHAVRVRAKLRPPRPLLQVLKELRAVDDVALRETLTAHPGAVRLGELLVELGVISEPDLERALARQREVPGQRIGDTLLELDILSPDQLYEVLSVHLGQPFVRPELEPPDAALLRDAPLEWCRKHRFLPIRRSGEALVVAFADPFEPEALAAARQVFDDVSIQTVLATPAAIEQVWARLEVARSPTRAGVADERQVVGLVDAMLDAAVAADASDVHVEPLSDRLRVRFRVDGALEAWRELPLSVAASLTSRLKILARADISERRRHQGGRFVRSRGDRHLDLRASFYVTVHGEKTVLRLLNRERSLVRLEELGMASAVLTRFREEVLDRPSGVTLVTGPTGSGKTTTLYSCVHYIDHSEIAIISAEDPVEYVMEGIAQCSLNPDIDLTYEETLRHIVRQDPDVVVIGEIRDRFSAQTAIQAALTGHKVLSTFHTEDSIGGLLRLLNMDIEAFLISSTVVSVLAQRLLRRVCEACAAPYEPSAVELRRLGVRAVDFTGAALRKGRGCSSCRRTGYRGRIGVFEMLLLGEEVREAIVSRRTGFEIRQISRESSGLVSLMEDALVKAAAGTTTLDEVARQVPRLDRPRPLAELRRLVAGSA